MIQMHMRDDDVFDLLRIKPVAIQRLQQLRYRGVGVVVDERSSVTIDNQVGGGKFRAPEIARINGMNATHWPRIHPMPSAADADEIALIRANIVSLGLLVN